MATTIHSTHMRTNVKLLNSKKLCVAEGYLSTVKAGQVLHTRVLQKDEVAVYVTNVFDSTCEVEEPFHDCLGECVNTVIRWKSGNVVSREEDAANKLQEHDAVHTGVFNTFEWIEEGGQRNTDEGRMIQENEQKKKFPYGHVRMENSKALPSGKVGDHSTQSQVGLEPELGNMEEPPTIQRKRSYRRLTRGLSKKPVARKIGEDRLEKVSLQSVKRWMTKSTCIAQCLKNISEKEIMDVRYKVWVNCKIHDNRVTWILGQMRTFQQQNAGTGWIDFNFYVDGKPVCNACYPHVLGYSRRQLERWKEDIQSRDR
jgi:hypothetical protein